MSAAAAAIEYSASLQLQLQSQKAAINLAMRTEACRTHSRARHRCRSFFRFTIKLKKLERRVGARRRSSRSKRKLQATRARARVINVCERASGGTREQHERLIVRGGGGGKSQVHKRCRTNEINAHGADTHRRATSTVTTSSRCSKSARTFSRSARLHFFGC